MPQRIAIEAWDPVLGAALKKPRARAVGRPRGRRCRAGQKPLAPVGAGFDESTDALVWITGDDSPVIGILNKNVGRGSTSRVKGSYGGTYRRRFL